MDFSSLSIGTTSVFSYFFLDKNRTEPEFPLHTNFKISAGAKLQHLHIHREL